MGDTCERRPKLTRDEEVLRTVTPHEGRGTLATPGGIRALDALQEAVRTGKTSSKQPDVPAGVAFVRYEWKD